MAARSGTADIATCKPMLTMDVVVAVLDEMGNASSRQPASSFPAPHGRFAEDKVMWFAGTARTGDSIRALVAFGADDALLVRTAAFAEATQGTAPPVEALHTVGITYGGVGVTGGSAAPFTQPDGRHLVWVPAHQELPKAEETGKVFFHLRITVTVAAQNNVRCKETLLVR